MDVWAQVLMLIWFMWLLACDLNDFCTHEEKVMLAFTVLG